MSKKFIALVLFAAMLLSLVPTAAAQSVDYTAEWPVVTPQTNGWYAGQNVENGISNGYDIGRRLLNGEMTDGLDLTWTDKGMVSGVYTYELKVKGSFSELQPYYYTHLAQNGAMGFALKMPVKITVAGTEFAQSAYIAGQSGYVNTYPGCPADVAYITAPLTAADQTFEYRVWYANSQRTLVKIVWENTDNIVPTAKNTAVPTLTVVGVAGAQKENFRADFTQAYWKKEAGTWFYYPGVLKFDIAAMTEADRVSILEAGENAMTIKVKALDKAGYTYPQGTIVTFQNEANQNMYLGSSDKFVTVNGEASYLIDNTGCFTMTFTGIQNFAWIAGTGDKGAYGWSMGSIAAATIDSYKALDDGNVYLYTLVSGGLKGVDNAKHTTIAGSFKLRFAYGNNAEELGFNLKYQNVARTKSGITLLSDVITVKVGEQTGIPYIVDNPMAMYQGVKGTWTYVNEKIAKAGTDVNGNIDTAVVKGVAVGTTYAYVTDWANEVELVVINVVPADFVEAPVVEPEVEVGTKYVVTASKLNVREGASTSYAKIRQINRNTVVTGTEVEGSVWVKLNDGGYVHGKYLAEVE